MYKRINDKIEFLVRMKIQSIKYTESRVKSDKLRLPTNNPKTQSFEGRLPASKSPFIDSILGSKLAQKTFKLASLNPHTFNLTIMAAMGIFIRPVSIMLVPGAKKEDKQYAAGKSVVSSTITTVTHMALCIPLAKSIEKLAIKAEKHPNMIKFPTINSPKFEAFNYLVNNGFAVILTLASSALMAEAVTKIMHKLVPEEDESPQHEGIHSMQTRLPLPDSFKAFAKQSEGLRK